MFFVREESLHFTASHFRVGGFSLVSHREMRLSGRQPGGFCHMGRADAARQIMFPPRPVPGPKEKRGVKVLCLVCDKPCLTHSTWTPQASLGET